MRLGRGRRRGTPSPRRLVGAAAPSVLACAVMRVLVIDTIAPEGIAHLEARGFQVDQVSSEMPRAELRARLGAYEADRDAVVDCGHRRVPRPRAAAAHPRTSRRGRRQHRCRGLLPPGRAGGQRPARQRGVGGRAHRGHAAGPGAPDPLRPRSAQAPDVGPQHLRHRAVPEDGGGDRPRQGGLPGGRAPARVRDGGAGVRSLHPRGARARPRGPPHRPRHRPRPGRRGHRCTCRSPTRRRT